MLRPTIAAASAAGLCLGSVPPLAAQNLREDAPRGVSATVNFHVPLGGATRSRRPTLGFTAGFGHELGAPDAFGRRDVRQIRLADFRLNEHGLHSARIAGFRLDRSPRLAAAAGQTPLPGLTPPPPDPNERDPGEERTEDKKTTGLLVIAFLLGVGVYFLADSDNDSDEITEGDSLGLPDDG